MFDCAMQGLKMYELVLFNNIFIQLFSSSVGSFFLVFPSRWLSITLDIQIDLNMKHHWKPLQKHIQNPVKHPRWRKQLTASQFLTIFAKRSILDVWQDSEFVSEAINNGEKAASQMLDRVLNSPLQLLIILAKRFT